jgi:hypothetical protein
LNVSGGCVRPVPMAFIAGTEPKDTCGPARYAPGVSPPRVVEPPAVAPAVPATPAPAADTAPQS